MARHCTAPELLLLADYIESETEMYKQKLDLTGSISDDDLESMRRLRDLSEELKRFLIARNMFQNLANYSTGQ